MNFKQFIQLTIVSTLVAWGIWIFLLFSIDPVFAGLFEFTLFYLTLFIAVSGTVLAIAVATRVQLKPDIILFRHVVTSFRQSLLLGVLFLGSLLLLSKNLFTWWSIFILIGLLSLIEWNAQSLRKNRPHSEHNNESTVSL